MLKEKYINKVKETAITIVNSQIESIREKNITKTGLRIYKNGNIGIAGAIGKYEEKELEDEAIYALSQNIKYDCELSKEMSKKVDKKSEIIKYEDFTNEVEEVLSQLRNEQPDFSFSNKIKIMERTTTLCNDNNLNLQYSDKALEMDLIFKEKASLNIVDGFFEYKGRKYDRKSFIDEINMILNGYKNKVELPRRKTYPVVFVQSNELIFRKFMTDLNGKLFGAGASLFSNKLGKKIFSEKFTLYQSLSPEDVVNEPFFDAEGVINRDYKYGFIENGVIKAPYTDKRTAKMFNLPHTGSASADYYDVPSLKFLNYKVKECEKTVKELLSGDIGILVMIAEGGDVTSKGDFSTPVQLSMLFDGDRIIGRLPEINVSSNIFDMFGDSFRGVGKDKVLPFSNDNFIVTELNVSKL